LSFKFVSHDLLILIELQSSGRKVGESCSFSNDFFMLAKVSFKNKDEFGK